MVSVAEEWRSIEGYEGFYEVSSLGRIRSLERMVATKTGSLRIHRGRILSGAIGNCGYRHFTARKEGVAKTEKVHRMVAETFVSGRAPGLEVNHINGIKTDNRAVNLEWVTTSENQQHAYRTGLSKAASRQDHWNCRLRENDVVAIRALAGSGGATQRAIAKKFGIAQTTVSQIVTRKIWK